MGWLLVTAKLAAALAVALVGIAGTAYAADAGVEATVLATHCNSVDPRELVGLPPLAALARQAAADGDVQVSTLFGMHYTRHLDALSCSAVAPGNVVVYHIRSGRTSIYTDASKSVCLFDSVHGEDGCSA